MIGARQAGIGKIARSKSPRREGDHIYRKLLEGLPAAFYATDAEGSIDIRAGGQGGNVAAWISACGGQSHLIGKVGDDAFGAYLIKEAGKRCKIPS